MYKAVIEMPKGSKRRIHHKYDKSNFHDFGPLADKIPVNNGIMPVNYGYLPNYFNKKENDEIDVLIFSNKKLKTSETIYVNPIATLIREDGDDKVVAVDKTIKEIKQWHDISEKERELIIRFFSYHHKILSIQNKKVTINNIKKMRI